MVQGFKLCDARYSIRNLKLSPEPLLTGVNVEGPKTSITNKARRSVECAADEVEGEVKGE